MVRTEEEKVVAAARYQGAAVPALDKQPCYERKVNPAGFLPPVGNPSESRRFPASQHAASPRRQLSFSWPQQSRGREKRREVVP